MDFGPWARTILDEVLQAITAFVEHQLAHAVRGPRSTYRKDILIAVGCCTELSSPYGLSGVQLPKKQVGIQGL